MAGKEPQTPQNVLVVDGGARGEALGWRLGQSPGVESVSFAPGNVGTARWGKNTNIPVTDIEDILKFSRTKNITLIVVGSETPLAFGLTNAAQKEGIAVFGPTKEAAQLETSKAFAAQFNEVHGIPQPEYRIFAPGQSEAAKIYIRERGYQNVVEKADGLCAGKGVVLPENEKDAFDTLDEMMVNPKSKFGEAGRTVVIQERLQGWEASIMAFTDGQTIVPVISAKDYKRLLDGDKGPNTGGMGAVVPNPQMTKRLFDRVIKTIVKPAVQGMKDKGTPFRGMLYTGVMVTTDGPKVLEYNARPGDPETQPQMVMLNADLYKIMKACAEGNLRRGMVKWRNGAAVGIVLAAPGYPDAPQKGTPIEGFYNQELVGHIVFFGAAKGDIATDNATVDGGRVMTIVGFGETIPKARENARRNIGEERIHFEGMQLREDIGE